MAPHTKIEETNKKVLNIEVSSRVSMLKCHRNRNKMKYLYWVTVTHRISGKYTSNVLLLINVSKITLY